MCEARCCGNDVCIHGRPSVHWCLSVQGRQRFRPHLHQREREREREGGRECSIVHKFVMYGKWLLCMIKLMYF